jgi:hypothetical protein
MRFQLIDAKKAELPVERMCALLKGAPAASTRGVVVAPAGVS